MIPEPTLSILAGLITAIIVNLFLLIALLLKIVSKEELSEVIGFIAILNVVIILFVGADIFLI